MKARREIIVDLFAGGGGASTAILDATGRHPDVAVNHDPLAIGVHAANHPQTRHYQSDVYEVDPVEACTIDGEVCPIGLLWMSPDCTHFSKARGGKPVEKGIRSLADVVLIWIDKLKPHDAHPRLISLENVEEFQDWGPVLENGKPCPERKGLDFRRWCKALEDRGYKLDWREMVAADYGAPTTRTVEANLQAIHHIIEARRVELRHGTLSLVRASMQGFKALPAPPGESWPEILGLSPGATVDEVKEAFRRLSVDAHPDKPTGSQAAMARLTSARDRALKQIGKA